MAELVHPFFLKQHYQSLIPFCICLEYLFQFLFCRIGDRRERSLLLFKSCFSPLYCTTSQRELHPGWNQDRFEGKNTSITLKTALCFPELQVGQDVAVPLQEWCGTGEGSGFCKKSIATRTENPVAFTELWIWQTGLYKTSGYLCWEVAGAILERWEILINRIISYLKESSKYVLNWMLICCSRFFTAMTVASLLTPLLNFAFVHHAGTLTSLMHRLCYSVAVGGMGTEEGKCDWAVFL